MILTLKNHEIADIIKVLDYKMKFQEGILRNKFIEPFAKKHIEIDQHRVNLISEIVKEEDETKTEVPTYIGEDGKSRYKLSEEGIGKFNAIYQKYLTSDIHIEIPEALTSFLSIFKTMITNSPVALSTKEIETIDYLLEQLDGKPVEWIEVAPETETKQEEATVSDDQDNKTEN